MNNDKLMTKFRLFDNVWRNLDRSYDKDRKGCSSKKEYLFKLINYREILDIDDSIVLTNILREVSMNEDLDDVTSGMVSFYNEKIDKIKLLARDKGLLAKLTSIEDVLPLVGGLRDLIEDILCDYSAPTLDVIRYTWKEMLNKKGVVGEIITLDGTYRTHNTDGSTYVYLASVADLHCAISREEYSSEYIVGMANRAKLKYPNDLNFPLLLLDKTTENYTKKGSSVLLSTNPPLKISDDGITLVKFGDSKITVALV